MELPTVVNENQSVQSRGPLYIVYGTTGGNSGRLAANLLAECRQHNYSGKLIHLGDFESNQFLSMKRIIFVVSTYGVGGPTNDAKEFYNWLEPLQDGSDIFAGVSYTVFGLGNSSFANFAGFGTKINEKLSLLGAKCVYPFARGDANNDTTDQDFIAWKQNLWIGLNDVFPLEVTTVKALRALEAGMVFEEYSTEVPEQNWDTYVFEQGKIESKLRDYFSAQSVKINEIKELRQKPDESSCLHVDLAVDAYTTAGNVGVFPQNSAQVITEFAKYQGYNLDNTFKLTASSASTRLPVPSPMKVGTFLERFCDFLGPVNKTIVQGLAALSGNAELQALTDMWVRDSEAFDRDVKQKNHSIFSLSIAYGFRIPLASLVQISNRIVPRFYTIASSALENPKNLQFCVSLLQVKDYNGASRFGQTSEYFAGLKKKGYANKRLRIFSQESLFELPKSADTPLIMIGPGAGIAPFRAFLQEKRYHLKQMKEKAVGECSLYFGCRGKKVDYIYQNDLVEFEKKGICEKLRVAFSRDGPNKVYVQDLLKEDIDHIAELILEKNAVIYVCGSRAVGEAVKDFIITLYTERGNMIPYLAYSKIDELQEEKRLLMEVWG